MKSIGTRFKKVNALNALLGFCCVLTFYSVAKADLGRELTDKEIQVLKANIDKNSQNIRARLFLGHHFFKKNDFKQTIQFLAPVRESLPNPELQMLAKSHLELNQRRDALSLSETLLSREKNLESLMLSIEIDDQIIRNGPNSPEGDEAKTHLFETLKLAVKEYPQESRLYRLWLENLQRHIPHYAFEALRVFEDMKKNNIPWEVEHYSLACQFNHEAGFIKETQSACEVAIQKDPQNPKNEIFLAKALLAKGEKEKGQRMLASLGEKFSDSPSALHATAVGYLETKDLLEAYQYFKKAAQHPKALNESFLGLGEVAFELRKYAESLRAFTEHCRRTQVLDQGFRKASGLLVKDPYWQNQFRQQMLDCQSSNRSTQN